MIVVHKGNNSPAILVKKCTNYITRRCADARKAKFSCHAARRDVPTTARGRVCCAIAISTD